MANAFNYMFEDRTFGIKAFCIFILVTISLLAGVFDSKESFIPLIITGVSGILIFGHFYECINSLKNIDETVTLPYLKPKTFWVGIKGGIGAMALNIAVGFVSVFTMYIPAIIIALSYPAIIAVYASDYKISSFFALHKAFFIIKNNIWKYIITLLILIFYTSLITTAMFIILNALGIKAIDLVTNGHLTHNIFSVTLFMSLFYTYNLYVFAYLISDLNRIKNCDIKEEKFA